MEVPFLDGGGGKRSHPGAEVKVWFRVQTLRSLKTGHLGVQ